MLGIPVLCRGFIAPYPCEEPLPSCENHWGLQLCSNKLVDWPDNFSNLFLNKNGSIDWLSVSLSELKTKLWFSEVLCCTFPESGEGFNTWSDKNSLKMTVGSYLTVFLTTRLETENKLLTDSEEEKLIFSYLKPINNVLKYLMLV